VVARSERDGVVLGDNHKVVIGMQQLCPQSAVRQGASENTEVVSEGAKDVSGQVEVSYVVPVFAKDSKAFIAEALGTASPFIDSVLHIDDVNLHWFNMAEFIFLVNEGV
jgi:hypothetical protein